MAELDKAQRLAISTLLDHGLFTGSVGTEMRQGERKAREAYQSPQGQQRINGWFDRVFGQVPRAFQDNWLWLMGPAQLSTTEVSVLLATLKAVINTPAVQGVEADRVIEVRPVITAVQSVVPGLTEREIRRCIHALFVARFGLLTPDNPEVEAEEARAVDEYWDVAVDFVAVASLIVQALKESMTLTTLTLEPVQRVNRYLLTHRYLDSKQRELWRILQTQKAAIVALWAPLQRFYLEVGDEYAVLLDGDRRQLKSRQYFVALAVAQTLGTGVAKAELGQRIKAAGQRLYPGVAINATQVKDELKDGALASLENGFWLATPVAYRFAIQAEDDADGK